MTNKKFNKTVTFVSVATIALGSLGLYSSSVLRNATPLKADEINTEVLEETLPTSEIAQGMVDGSLVSETSETSESAVMSESEDTSEEVIESTEEAEASESTTEVESVVDTDSTKENSVKKETFETRAEPTYTIDGSTLTIHAGEVNQDDFFGRKGVQKELITKVVIDGPITGTTHSKFLKEFTNVEEIIGLENIDLTNSASIDGFFYGCEKIKEVDISAWKTDNIGSISTLFYNCYSIESIDLSTFNTSNVWDMGDVFFNCKNLTNLNINNWDTSNVIQMWRMFSGCEKLETINIAHFDTSSVTNMNSMFKNCLSLTNLDVSNFDTSNVENMNEMFYHCESLPAIDVSNWDVSKVKIMENMFQNCIVTTLDVGSWDTSSLEKAAGMFNSCELLENLDVSNWNVTNLLTAELMFFACRKLPELNVSNWELPNLTSARFMFAYCESLSELDTSKFDLSSCTSLEAMFAGTTNLSTVAVSDWNTSNVTTMARTFNGCKSLKNIDVSNWKVENVETMSAMFKQSGITSINISNFVGSNLSDAEEMFGECKNLEIVQAENIQLPVLKDAGGMFTYCTSLKEIDTSKWETPLLEEMNLMFFECAELTKLDLSSLIVTNVFNMQDTFNGCVSLTELNLEGWSTSNLENMHATFARTGLTSLDLTHFDTSKVTEMFGVFTLNENLKTIDISTWDTSNVVTMERMFHDCPSLESLNIENIDLSNVTNTLNMFDVRGISSLAEGEEPGDLVLSHMVLGPNFSLVSHTDTKFDTLVPPTEAAKWSRKGEDGKFNLVPLTAEELATTYDGSTMAGDWYWVESLGLKVKDHEMMVGDEWIAQRDHFVSVTDEFGNPSTWEEQNVQVVNLSDIKTNLADTYQVEFKSDAFEEVAKLLVNAGELTIIESPSTLYFGDHKISNTSQTYDVEQLDKPLKITDLRGIENAGWSLTAKMLVELTNEEQSSVLDNSITYTDEVRDQVITANDSALIYSTLTEGTDEIAIPLEEYLKLEVPTGKARQGAYTGTIVWELNNAPANEIN